MVNNSELKISLVIPAYNEEKYIGKCLQAVIDSGAKFCEIIVIDNASKDKTSEVANTFAVHGVRVVREEKKGLTHARQRGYKEATGDIIANIDSDTVMHKGWFEDVLNTFMTKKNVVCVSGPCYYYDIPKIHQWVVKYIYWYLLAMPIYYLIGFMVMGSNFALRKSTLDSMGGFDTTVSFYGEDTNTARRASVFGKVLFSPKFYMNVSGRRLKTQGYVKTGFLYIKNFLSEVLFKKPATKDYLDIN